MFGYCWLKVFENFIWVGIQDFYSHHIDTQTHIYILLCWAHLTIRISCSIFKALEVFAGSQVSLVCRRFENLCAKLLLNAAGDEKSEHAPALRVCVRACVFCVGVYVGVQRCARLAAMDLDRPRLQLRSMFAFLWSRGHEGSGGRKKARILRTRWEGPGGGGGGGGRHLVYTCAVNHYFSGCHLPRCRSGNNLPPGPSTQPSHSAAFR